MLLPFRKTRTRLSPTPIWAVVRAPRVPFPTSATSFFHEHDHGPLEPLFGFPRREDALFCAASHAARSPNALEVRGQASTDARRLLLRLLAGRALPQPRPLRASPVASATSRRQPGETDLSARAAITDTACAAVAAEDRSKPAFREEDALQLAPRCFPSTGHPRVEVCFHSL